MTFKIIGILVVCAAIFYFAYQGASITDTPMAYFIAGVLAMFFGIAILAFGLEK